MTTAITTKRPTKTAPTNQRLAWPRFTKVTVGAPSAGAVFVVGSVAVWTPVVITDVIPTVTPAVVSAVTPVVTPTVASPLTSVGNGDVGAFSELVMMALVVTVIGVSSGDT